LGARVVGATTAAACCFMIVASSLSIFCKSIASGPMARRNHRGWDCLMLAFPRIQLGNGGVS
jgi:hypothetical protein